MRAPLCRNGGSSVYSHRSIRQRYDVPRTYTTCMLFHRISISSVSFWSFHDHSHLGFPNLQSASSASFLLPMNLLPHTSKCNNLIHTASFINYLIVNWITRFDNPGEGGKKEKLRGSKSSTHRCTPHQLEEFLTASTYVDMK